MSGGVHWSDVSQPSSSSTYRIPRAPSEEVDDPERQPLLRRQATRIENRERFEHNQRTAAQGVWQQSTWALLIVIILIAVFFLLWAVMYYWAFLTWWSHREKPCDQNLANWLLAMLVMPFFTLSAECFYRRMRLPVLILTLLVLVMGFHNFYHSKTCEKTNPELYAFVRRYLLFLAAWWFVLTTMPVIFIAVVVYGMWHGWFDEINGASPDTIKSIETISFDPALFAQEGQDGDSRPEPECCVCKDDFDAGKTIKRTSCQHYFHEECLARWLRNASTCPLCRKDLEIHRSEEGESKEARMLRQEARRLRDMYPSLDQEAAEDIIRQSGGSADEAARFFEA